MSKTFALFAAVAALALASPAAFAATADSAPPGYTTWTSTPSNQQPVVTAPDQSAHGVSFASGVYDAASPSIGG